MCGITCCIRLNRDAPTPSSTESYDLERDHLSKCMDDSLELIKHRGPDDRGYWFSRYNRVVLGHVRLSIVDLSEAAQQPFHDIESTVHAVICGEFYEYEQIRDDLIKKGHSFTSNCDSEILIALYKEYGMGMMDHLRGEFAFVLYDEESQHIIAGRDRYGVKPLFYTITPDGRLLIASEIKAFLGFGWEPQWDIQSMLETGHISDTRTVFKGVKRIRAGHYLTLQGFENITQQEYWEINYPEKHQVETRTEEEMIQGVRDHLLDAVRVRLRADVPVGIFLSGGLDSSAIAGMIKHLMVEEGVRLGDAKDASANINCYSIKFMDDEFDEEPIAQRTADWLGVKKHVVRMTEDEFVKNYSDAVWHTEFPMLDLNFIGKVALSRLTRETGIKVILTGEGSDEQFAGYQNYLADFVREPDYSMSDRPLPEQKRKEQLDAEEQPSTKSTLAKFPMATTPSTMKARRQVNNVSIVGIAEFLNFRIFLSQWTRDEYGTADPRAVAVHNAFSGTIRQKMLSSWHPLYSSMYIWQRIFLANILLTALGDRVEMSNSIEGRQPYLDHKLTEYVNGLPPSMKLRYDPETKTFNEKYILKEAARPFITEELYQRRKHPFSAPLKYAKNGPLHRYFSSLMTRENVEELGFLDWEKCKNLIEDGFIKEDAVQMRNLFQITQLIEIGKRFGVKRARPEFEIENYGQVASPELTQPRL